MLDILCQVADSAWVRNDGQDRSPAHQALLRTLQLRLQRLEQRLPSVEDAESLCMDKAAARLQQTAELYRLATLIYLERVSRNTPRSCPRIKTVLDDAFNLLQSIGVCQRPWPLFVVALDARSDDERRLVLDILSEVLRVRPYGNMRNIERMVEAAWIQQDFSDGEFDQLFIFNAVISAFKLPPSFT
jgi:Fungal specific transcription factor domain